ncbi:MAG: hypothetical protein M1834_006964 [Cirrosporium novae-zelandiae]|nr:MAG: hypothetical protein M1834_006964 [Cirrosporium novae-zelandiae]
MGKRLSSEANSERWPKNPKRQRVGEPLQPPQEIRDAYHLQSLLAFQQDIGPAAKAGVQSFKLLLEGITYAEDSPERTKKQNILVQYCNISKPKDNQEQHPLYLQDLVQCWSLAAQSNNESLLSSVPSVLALLLKTISNILELREFGIGICKGLLLRDQLKLLERGLGAATTKEHLIAPCLRLLTEIVSFDGGALAKNVYLHRDTTYKRLEDLLKMRKELTGDPEKDRRRPSIRTNAIRFLLANFKFQDQIAKADVLDHYGKIIKSFLHNINSDSAEVAAEIINVLEKHIVLDKELSKFCKRRIFTDWNLLEFATLYTHENTTEVSPGKTIHDIVHQFLSLICTKPEAGILLPQTGWYPSGTHPDRDSVPEEEEDDDDAEPVNLGLDSPYVYEKYRDSVPVRNTILASFISRIRPSTNILQAELIQKIFEVAPELIANYFLQKKTSPLSDPKVSPFWLGHAGFLFSAVQLPVPAYCGWTNTYPQRPPPVSIVIENILPQALPQKILARCLNLHAEIITLFGLRLLAAAFEKLHSVLKIFAAAGERRIGLWSEASKRLVSEFCRRCPRMKDVISTLHNVPKDDPKQREAALKLLALYYMVVPEMALAEKLDVSILLSETLSNVGNTTEKERRSRLVELQHLLDIAERSPDMRWFSKGSLTLSPFTTILRIYVEEKARQEIQIDDLKKAEDTSVALPQIGSILQGIAQEHSIIQKQISQSSFFALVDSLAERNGWKPIDHTFIYLDNCILRFVRNPLKYYDFLSSIIPVPKGQPISLLLIALIEQLPFALKSDNEVEKENCVRWFGRFLAYARQAGEDREILKALQNKISDMPETTRNCRRALKKGVKEQRPGEATNENETAKDDVNEKTNIVRAKVDATQQELDDLMLVGTEDKNHSGLRRWMQEEIPNAVEDGHIGRLISCLSSKHEEIRKQALIAIQQLMSKLKKTSNYPEWQQVYLLLGELTETAKVEISTRPLARSVCSFASHAVMVVADPLHCLYGKINEFLNRGPSWKLNRLARYWTRQIVLQEPGQPNSHNQEIGWLLDVFIEGLRSEEDLELYRHSRIFERILSLYSSSHISALCKHKIVQLLYFAVKAGGSDMLISQFGVANWIKIQLSMKDKHDVILHLTFKALKEQVNKRTSSNSTLGNGAIGDSQKH